MLVRLKDVAAINAHALSDSTPSEFSFRYIDIGAVTQGKISMPVEEMTFGSAPSRARRLAESGDTVVSTVRTYLRAVAAVPETDEPLVFSTGFAVLHPRNIVDDRCLSYCCQSARFVDEIVARSVGVSYPAINPGDIGNFRFDLPSLEEQRRIANFLDVETERIDRLHGRVAGTLALIDERADAVVDMALRLPGQPVKKLKYVARVTVGIVVTPSAWYVAGGGVPALRGLNVKPGRLDEDDLVQISHEGHAVHLKSRLSAGDVVVVRTGQAGAAAVVPPKFDGANCIDLLLIRRCTALNPRFLEFFLNCSKTRRAVGEESVGSIQAHYNVGAIRGLDIPVPPLSEQEAMVRSLDREVDHHVRLRHLLRREQALLIERRSALITAAVSGQLDVTAARGAA